MAGDDYIAPQDNPVTHIAENTVSFVATRDDEEGKGVALALENGGVETRTTSAEFSQAVLDATLISRGKEKNDIKEGARLH